MVATLGLAVVAVFAADKEAWKPSFDAEKKAVAYLKENVNDLSKFMLVRASKPFNIRGWKRGQGWIVLTDDGVAVYVKYRTANEFGAVQLKEDVFIFRKDGSLFANDPASDIRAPVDVPKDTRFTDEFLDRYRH